MWKNERNFDRGEKKKQKQRKNRRRNKNNQIQELNPRFLKTERKPH